MRRYWKSILGSAVSVLLAVVLVVTNSVPVYAVAWYNTSWLYRKAITVADASANYQTKITVYYGSGADATDIVYLSSHCQTDFDDLRFTGADGTTLLDYWIESKTDSNNAVVWVENDATPSATCYIYYGNAGAAAASNGDNTFLFFDDFTAAWPDGEWSGDTASGSVVGGILTFTNPGVGQKVINSNTTVANDVAMRTRLALAAVDYSGTALSETPFNNDDVFAVHHSSKANQSLYVTTKAGVQTEFSNLAIDFGNLHIFDVGRLLSGVDTVDAYYDGTQAGADTTTNVPTPDMTACIRQYNAGTITCDWILLRNYTYTEPTFTFGAEVTLPTVTSSAASDVLTTTATANGNITATGGENCDKRGVVYDLASQALPGNVVPGASGYALSAEDAGSYGTGVFTKGLVGLTANTPYYYRTYAHNSAGYSYSASEQTFTTTVLGITSSAATNVEETTATGNGNITDLGGAANADKRGVVYGTSSHVQPGDVTPAASGYDNFAEDAGAFGLGAFTKNVVGLNKGTLYYYRTYAHTVSGYGYSSSEQTFLTKPDPPTVFSIAVTSSAQLTLSWIPGDGCDVYMVRYKLGVTAPTIVTDGTQIFYGAATGYGHTSLDPGTAYSYSVWGIASDGGLTQYSDTYIFGTATTSSTSVYLANFKYYIPITVSSQCSTSQTLRVPFIVNSDGLYDGGYVQADFDDVVLARVDTLMPLTVTDISATTMHKDGEATATDNTTALTDDTLTQADDYWNGTTLTITETTDGLAPEGETSIITDFDQAIHTLTFGALTASTTDGDLYTLDNYRSKYFTDLTLAPYQQVELDLYCGYAGAGAANKKLCTDSGDTIKVLHNADYNITDNVTVSSLITLFELPSAEKHFVSKNGAYELGIDVANKPYFKIWHAGPATDNATGASALVINTAYILTGTYNDASDNITMYVNTVVVGSKSDVAGAVSTSSDNITLANLDNCQIDNIQIGHTSLIAPTYVLDLQMEATHIGESSILDQSPAVHNASVIWDISMPSCITVDVGPVTEVATWVSPGGTTQADIEVFPLPTTPSNWALMGNRTTWNTLPVYQLMTTAATQLGWSDGTMYRIMVVFTAIGVGVAVGIATASALLTGVAVGIILAMGAGAGIVGWALIVMYGLFAMGWIVASRSM